MAGHARPLWGWHQLDSSFADRLVAEAGLRPGDVVIDVGAGRGALTAALLRAGAVVVAVELHPGRADDLRRRFAGDPVTVVRADAADLRLPRRPFKVVANPPFAVLKPVLRRLLSRGSQLAAADLIVPRHVASEWCGQKAPGWGRWQVDFVVERGRSVPPFAFTPPSPKGAVVLRVRRRQ